MSKLELIKSKAILSYQNIIFLMKEGIIGEYLFFISILRIQLLYSLPTIGFRI